MLKKILICGAAGKSSIYLIEYLANYAIQYEWKITVCDLNIENLALDFGAYPQIHIIAVDIFIEEERKNLIQSHDIVISMLPAHMHINIMFDCLLFKKHFFTASYVSEEMEKLSEEVKNNDLLFMNEMGLDPGLDHMSAMKVIDEIREKGGKLIGFESYCGGLIAPESDDNPLHYKFTWNPRNVVLAGSAGTVKFLQHGKHKYIPYHQLFSRTDEFEIEGFGKFEGYANRDSLKYIDIYGLHGIQTMYRGTFRRPGFAAVWNAFIHLGLTDDHFILDDTDKLTYLSFLQAFLPETRETIQNRVKNYLKTSDEVISIFKWLGLFTDTRFNTTKGSPAQLLQEILEKKLVLKKEDKDLVVMVHTFEYVLENEKRKLQSSLVLTGKDQKHTAMAKTVGLPLAIFTKNFLLGKIDLKGVQRPTHKEVYNAILLELGKEHNIVFNDIESKI